MKTKGKHEAVKAAGEIRKTPAGYKIWAVIFCIFSALFAGMLVYLNLLTGPVLGGICAFVAVVCFVIVFVLWRKSKRKAGKVIAVILSVLLASGYTAGIYYIAHTVDFLSDITREREEIKEFYVIVKDDSPLESVSELDGLEVLISDDKDPAYSKGRNKLKDEVNVKYNAGGTDLEVLERVLSEEAVVFISSNGYENGKEHIEGLEDDSRILYNIKVSDKAKDISKGVDVTKTPFNVYITGIDTEGTIDVVSRSDVNMVVTVNPLSKKILMTSIPRDAYVPLQGEGHEGAYDKITHTGIYGVDETVETGEAVLGIDINYYGKVNFTTVQALIDVIGGVDVESDLAFVSRNGYYYAEGMNHLDGAMALSFARERKAFSNGDFQRNRNQQLVLEGVIKKATTSSAILTGYTDILSTIKEYFATNMKSGDIQKLIKMQLSDMTGWDIEMQGLKGSGGSEPCYSAGGGYASVVYLDENSVNEARDNIYAVMSEKGKTE